MAVLNTARIAVGPIWAAAIIVFPLSLSGAPWLGPSVVACALVAALFSGYLRIRPRGILIFLGASAAFLAPSISPCWSGQGICERWLIELELYILLNGAMLYFGGLIAGRDDGLEQRWLAAVLLLVYLGVATTMLLRVDDLSAKISGVFAPLLIERNDLVPLVAWIFFLLGLALARKSAPVAQWAAIALVVTVTVMLCVATRSRLVVVTSLLGIISCSGLPTLNRAWQLVVASAIVVVAVAFLFFGDQVRGIIDQILHRSGAASLDTRGYLWALGIKMFQDQIWLGHGSGAFAALFQQYAAHTAAPTTMDLRPIPWPHNVFVELLVEKGVLGAIALITVFGIAASTLVRAHHLIPFRLRRAAWLFLIAFLLIGFVDSSTKRLWYLPSVLFGLGFARGLAIRFSKDSSKT